MGITARALSQTFAKATGRADEIHHIGQAAASSNTKTRSFEAGIVTQSEVIKYIKLFIKIFNII